MLHWGPNLLEATAFGGRLEPVEARRCTITVAARPYIHLSADERRTYSDLDEAEKAIIQVAVQREYVTRDIVLDSLSDEFTKTDLRDAFTSLCDEQRLFRVGNKAEHVLIERDLF